MWLYIRISITMPTFVQLCSPVFLENTCQISAISFPLVSRDGYTHTHKPKYTLNCGRISNSFSPGNIHNYFFWHFFILHTNGERCSHDGFCLCHSKYQVVIVYHILSFSHPRVCLVKLQLFGFFFGLVLKK